MICAKIVSILADGQELPMLWYLFYVNSLVICSIRIPLSTVNQIFIAMRFFRYSRIYIWTIPKTERMQVVIEVGRMNQITVVIILIRVNKSIRLILLLPLLLLLFYVS